MGGFGVVVFVVIVTGVFFVLLGGHIVRRRRTEEESNFQGGAKWFSPLVPACITFGPVFIVLGIPGRLSERPESVVGAFMLMFGCVFLFLVAADQERRIHRLEQQIKGHRKAGSTETA